MFETMESAGLQPTKKTYNIMISQCGKAGLYSNSEKYFDQMDRGIGGDVFACNSMITVYRKQKNWKKAVEIFKCMQQGGIEPDIVTYNATISACRHSWKQALDIFKEMETKGMIADNVAYSSVIMACGNGNQSKRALELFSEMETKGIAANNITYNAVISACGRVGQWGRALELLKDMEKKGIVVDAVTYNSVMMACGKGGQMGRVLDLLKEMELKGIAADTVSYNTAITACGKGEGGHSDQALMLLKNMDSKKIAANEVTYSAIIDVIGWDHPKCMGIVQRALEKRVWADIVSQRSVAKVGRIDVNNLSTNVSKALVRYHLVEQAGLHRLAALGVTRKWEFDITNPTIRGTKVEVVTGTGPKGERFAEMEGFIRDVLKIKTVRLSTEMVMVILDA